ncbi:dopamine receptor [Biomphalaria glabrata]|uniref:D(2) dopamine receptor A-like n=1 Tax=Biomphalaria glabrata TaxID=6526 RepID=A0A9W3B655_BIOGL|nr:D(2) dopamine receptor A-like [Biomphalaria glabrata]XP_055895031.1 D(2) dopamine receptor A-like [Biomphalaria glabrata]XP_055895032.1 D(2) dopamine receptor A-like [Biomphalaria glabrata]XP_055895033.1 D(2) dopamine receptor A-like [Biomphalaria glabrata]XP_055895034.1 D(2) dopamine receptor A-like [Biomphalaria glabrata]XP_055895035.1 D(2) dopamine receptor A-like [Biomphalaria glabrata]XP_055895036.1 D(2) dopamine receptor A-like [Biomphalaria glabrata]XP_055895037.1 D(2) dopamine rec
MHPTEKTSSEVFSLPENFSNVTSIEEVNQEKLITLIPVILLFAIFLVIGVIGNSLVVYVFGFKMKSGTQNILIVILALFDVLTSLLSIPHEITVSVFIVMYPSAISCKIFRFINTFCSAGSMFTLLLIAVDRYRKICLPLRPQMYTRHVKRSMIPILIFAVLISLPAFAVHGQRTIDTDIPGLYGKDCSTPDEIGKTIIPLIYNLVMFLVFFTITIALAVLYTFILRETNRHNREKSLRAKYNLPSSSNSSSDRTPAATNTSFETASVKNSKLDITQESDVGSESSCYTLGQSAFNLEQTIDPSTKTDDPRYTQLPPSSEIQTKDLQTLDVSQTCVKPKRVIRPGKYFFTKAQKAKVSKSVSKSVLSKNSSNPAKATKRRFKNKTTIIAFLVTLVFILSFLPHFILQVTKFSKLIVDYRLHGAGLAAYNIFLRSYFINSVSNPFIYGVLNTRFSSEVGRLWRRLTCRS